MTLKDAVLYCIDTKLSILSSNVKGEEYKYRKVEEALNFNFIQFGSKYFSNTISIDVDNTDAITIYNKLQELTIPTPTMLVETPRGVHLHWLLKHTISVKNTKSVFVRNKIVSALIALLGGDPHAVGMKRVFRNPLQYATAFSDVMYSFEDFYKFLPATPQTPKVSGKCSKRKTKAINWKTVQVGDRHTKLFEAVSQYAYTISEMKQEQMFNHLYKYATTCNNAMPTPQTDREICTLCSSITTWMCTKYTGSSDKATKFNQDLANKKADKAKNKIKVAFVQAISSMACVADIRKLSGRRGSKMCDVAKATFLKYKAIILEEVKQLLLKLKDNTKVFTNIFSVFTQDNIKYNINWSKNVRYIFSP